MKTSKMLSLPQFRKDMIIKSLQKITSHYTAPAYFLILVTQTKHKHATKENIHVRYSYFVIL